ncbi:MAG TPA: molybdate ABC transporter substrate-binding protein [Candidatus Acidoferrales bacterium]|nr:molybdate ABC transporter substrate-binding protein [Candidatus Acidoferrales bacterium]
MKSALRCWAGAAVSLALVFGPAPAASTGPLTVAAAADFQFALRELARGFEQRTGRQVRLVIGSSENLTTQIERGAPFDLLFSADVGRPERLVREGLADRASLIRYAAGRLVVVVPKDSRVEFDRQGLAALDDDAVKKIAIANPRFAPYGRAAVAALEHFGLYSRLAGKLVLGEDVSQATQFVVSGNAQAGFSALALMLAPGAKPVGRYWLVPADSYPPLEQAAVVLRSSGEKDLAQAFLQGLATPQAAAILARYGFAIPEKKR